MGFGAPLVKIPYNQYSTINANVEMVSKKPVYKDTHKHRRYLVSVDRYYEWKKAGDRKQLFIIHLGRPFAFAGLWDH